MPVDHIRYDLLTQDALRGVIRTVLADAAVKGLPGEHHFFITFDTRVEGVRLSARLKASYPEEMTVVLQHQFWDLAVGDDEFEVGLAFNGIRERLQIPFKAVTGFFDPSVQFGLQFAVEGEATAPSEEREKKLPATASPARKPRLKKTEPAAPEPAAKPAEPAAKPAVAAEDKRAGEKIVRLDRFRKK